MKAIKGIRGVDFAEESLSGGFIVEAVVTLGMLAKLKAKGFEVSKIPPEK